MKSILHGIQRSSMCVQEMHFETGSKCTCTYTSAKYHVSIFGCAHSKKDKISMSLLLPLLCLHEDHSRMHISEIEMVCHNKWSSKLNGMK